MKKQLTAILLVIRMIFGFFGCFPEPVKVENTYGSNSVTASASNEVQAIVCDQEFYPLVMENLSVNGEPIEWWGITREVNLIPYIPEDYEGNTINVTTSYTCKDGNTYDMTYEGVAYFDFNADTSNYDYDCAYAEVQEFDGKQFTVQVLYDIETLYFLDHMVNNSRERIYLDIDVPFDMDLPELIGKTDSLFLFRIGSYIHLYNLVTNEITFVTNEALEYKYPVDDVLYFIDFDHHEHIFHWKNEKIVSQTGKTIIKFWENNEPIKCDEFQDEFIKIQEAMRNGNDDYKMYSDKYTIIDGYVFQKFDGEYMANLHLPYATKWAYREFNTYGLYAMFVHENKLTMYRYGDKVREYELPKGNWQLLQCDVKLKNFDVSLNAEELVDMDANGFVSIEEMNQAIASITAIVADVDTKSVYKFTNGNITKIAADVQDYSEMYGILYWMDSNFNAYICDWLGNAKNVLIGKDVVGISKYELDGEGFIVRKGDDRCDFSTGGFNICTFFSEKWLNEPVYA